MSYQVLARKWRPQSFDQLIGQEHVSQTLMNALRNNRIPHALLFTGLRGTGKTSSARILAKSLRCPQSTDFRPCNECTDCQEISQGNSFNVVEMDGASNNGVDAIRILVDGVLVRPSTGKYKVYIIDEVHMLSINAFNALLKTLEEPPPHVVFILATTEVHKIPQTILSRCQRFDFKRIPTRKIAEFLGSICTHEGIPFEEEALWMIARQGDGSMRDSQSILDQIITFSDRSVTKEQVIVILGLTDRALILEMLKALIERDVQKVLKSLSEWSSSGYEPHLFIEDLLENIRNLLIVQLISLNSVDAVNRNRFLVSNSLDLPDSEIKFLENLGKGTTPESIHLLFDMALKGASDIPRSNDPRLVLEMVLLRMAAAPRVLDLEKWMLREKEVNTSHHARPAVSTSSLPSPQWSNAAASSVDPSWGGEKWLDFVQKIKAVDPLFSAKIEGLLFMSVKDKTLQIVIPQKLVFLEDQMRDRATHKKLQSYIDRFWGSGYDFEISIKTKTENEKITKAGGQQGYSAQSLAEEKEKKQNLNLAEAVAQNPKIKTISQVFQSQVQGIQSVNTK